MPSVIIQTDIGFKMSVQSSPFPPQTKALQSNTTRSTCCQWPIGVKIQMDPSFSCKQHLFLPVIDLVHY